MRQYSHYFYQLEKIQSFTTLVLLFDNREDKGMEMIRSHHSQKLLVERATKINAPYQVIYTISMMNPALELDDCFIGQHYDHDNKTLDLGH